MSGALPKALAEEYEAKLRHAKGREVDEYDGPLCKFEQVVRQNEGAGAADQQVEEGVVHEPGDPVCGLGQAHHRHRLTHAGFLLTHHAVRYSESRREERQQGRQR